MEMLGWGLSTETSAPEASPWEQAGVEETAWGTRNWSVGFSGKRLPRGSRKQSVGLVGKRLPGSPESQGWREQYAKGWGVESTLEGTWEKSWICRRDKAPVLGRGAEEGWAAIEYSPHHRELTCPPAIRKLGFPVHPPSPYPMFVHRT